ncbi:MAG: DUF2723 domain-containing protein [Candidatus Eisenbacteria bacterium]
MERGLEGKHGGHTPAGTRADRAVGLLVFACALGAYAVTLSPSVSFWDSGEFIAASTILAVPHPPGTPLYVLIGRVFSLVPGLPVPVRVNLLSAIPGAFAALFLYLTLLLIGRRLLPREPDSADRWRLRIGCAAGSLFAAFGTTSWTNAVEAEVYAASLLVLTFCTWVLLRWGERREGERGQASLLLVAYLLSLSISVHLGTYLALPAFFLFLLAVDRRVLLDGRFLAMAVFFTLLGVTVHFYLPIRSTLNPVIDEANPETRQAFLDFLLRKQYKPNNPLIRQASWAFQLGMYRDYFLRQYGLLLPLLGVFGVWAHAARARRSFLLYGSLFLLTSLFLVFYMNFTDHEVRDRDYFFAPSFVLWGGWMGLGAIFLLGRLREVVSPRRESDRALHAGLALLPAVLLAAFVVSRFEAHDRRGNYIAHDYAWNILTRLEENAVIFTNGDNDTFPLWYLQEVAGVRKDVRVANLALLNTPWYIWQLKHLEPRVPFEYTDAEIEQLRPFRTRDGEIVSVKDQAVFEIIRANGWEKPLYFAVTVPDLMGLDGRRVLRLEGLVYRVMPDQQEKFVDVARSEESLWNHYRYRGILTPAGERDGSVAKDSNEAKLIANYSTAFSRLAIQLRNNGEHERAIRAMEMAARITPRYRVYEALMGPLYAEAERYEQAETLFARQMAEHEDSLAPYLGLAYVREKQGREEEADSLYRLGIAAVPDHPEGYMRLCRLCLRRQDLAGAREVLRAWLAALPNDATARAQLRELEAALAPPSSGGGETGGP